MNAAPTPRFARRQFLKLTGVAATASILAACTGKHVPADGVPQSEFSAASTAEEVTEGADLEGKIALVTGCTSGIGYETMRVLAMRGAYVLGTSRSLERAEQACRTVPGLTTPLALDLADPESVIACADAARSLKSPIDMLICNAGYRGGGNDREVVNGVEKHFAINHLGHFLLVNRLLDRLYVSWQGRVVIVASRAAYRDAPVEGIRFGDMAFAGDYDDGMAYGHSKLANVLFSNGLARRLRGTRITSNALHPGVINTEIDRNLSPVLQSLFAMATAVAGKSTQEGAATTCHVATSKLLGSTSGRYFEDCNAVEVDDPHMNDQAQADKLWDISEEMLSGYLVTHERPDWNEFQNGLRQMSPETVNEG